MSLSFQFSSVLTNAGVVEIAAYHLTKQYAINFNTACVWRWIKTNLWYQLWTLYFLTAKAHSDVQGEHKVFPWLQTFITRKLRGIQTYFLPLLKLVSNKMVHLHTGVHMFVGFWMQHFQADGLGEMVRHPGHHDRRISPPLTSFYGGMLRTKCFRHQFQILQIWRQK